MQKHHCRWTRVAIVVLAASTIAAGPVPAQKAVTDTVVPALPGLVTKAAPAIVVPKPAIPAGPQQTLAVSPLLANPLSTTTKSLSIAPPTLRILPQPLLPANSLRVDLALNSVTSTSTSSAAELERARSARIDALVSGDSAGLDLDERGNPVVRGQILAFNPGEDALRRAAARGFSILRIDHDPLLDIRTVVLGAPAGIGTSEAMRLLRSSSPRLLADYNSIYLPAGAALAPSSKPVAGRGRKSEILIGMVDGGVASHPSLAGRVVDQKGFAGAARATGHGTAVASLLVGSHDVFRGAASNASLLVADVYGGKAAGGSAVRIVQALGWLASKRPRVINISLVGPQNALMKRAVDAVRARGIMVVAPVGNDGPAAPPQYPASYAGVVSVTAVDSRGVALFESGRAAHLDFAAPGADMAAASPGNGYSTVRGTSFAAPLAAGRLALLGSVRRLASEAEPGKGQVGQGIVCSACRIAPRLVGAR